MNLNQQLTRVVKGSIIAHCITEGQSAQPHSHNKPGKAFTSKTDVVLFRVSGQHIKEA